MSYEMRVSACVMCDGTGRDARYDVPNPNSCPVCGGSGAWRFSWHEGEDGELVFVQHGPADPAQGEMEL